MAIQTCIVVVLINLNIIEELPVGCSRGILTLGDSSCSVGNMNYLWLNMSHDRESSPNSVTQEIASVIATLELG